MEEIVRDLEVAWIKGEGPLGQVVLSSRVRLARNLEGFPFPDFATSGQRRRVLAIVKSIFEDPAFEGRMQFVDLSSLSNWEREALAELNLISREHAQPEGERAVILSHDGSLSIMVNEEDHLRLQCLLPGLQLDTAWQILSQVDDLISSKVRYAFSPRYGFLTSCPTNVGTGLRASVMVHLPGLQLLQQAESVLRQAHERELTIRGIHGEGTESAANLYQISNRRTLGVTEEEIIYLLDRMAREIAEREIHARLHLLRRRRLELLDRVRRAYGILTHASLINSSEARELLSWVKLGADLGLLPVSSELVRRLMACIEPGCLQIMRGEELPPERRDAIRAKMIRECLLERAKRRVERHRPTLSR